MTKVKITDNSVEIIGHSGYAKSGEDIVCAAVSVLSLTAVECMFKEQDEKHLKVLECDVGKGYVYLEWKGKADFLTFLKTGFELLIKNYSEYVKEA